MTPPKEKLSFASRHMLKRLAKRETSTSESRIMVRMIAEQEVKHLDLPRVTTKILARQLEAELHLLKKAELRVDYLSRERKNERDTIIFGIEYVLDALLLPSRAHDVLINLEDTYNDLWLPKYGRRAARFLFATQAAGVIWSTHGHRLTKWLGGVLGLAKLYGWFSGFLGG